MHVYSAVFIEKCLQMAKKDAYTAMITQHAFMFLSSYEKLRKNLLNTDFISMVHLGARAFEEIGGEVVQTSTFIMRRGNIKDYKATYARLVDYNNQHEKEKAFLAKKDLHIAQKENFLKIPGSPIAYWASKNFIKSFERGTLLGDLGKASEGIKTGDNNRFLRLWFEVSAQKFAFFTGNLDMKWFPHHKGGEYRKWYGNLEYVINWENNGYEIKNFKNSGLQGKDMYFKEVLCWSKITSKGTTLRYIPANCLFDSGSPAYICNKNLLYTFAFINSIGQLILKTTNPTLNCQVGDIKALPLITSQLYAEQVDKLVEQNISISKKDWDSFETSWEFKRHPLINGKSIFSAFKGWEEECNRRVNKLKSNEQKLTEIFVDVYGLEEELANSVDEEVTIRRADITRDTKLFISYAVGCMFGRYSLNREGLAYAGGDWDDSKYTSFIPDADNIIVITEDEYFTDDIVNRFVEFVKVVYGDETLEENLDFIANALGNKGNTSREVIRNYFIKDFYKDYCKIYQKRPIYWLFDSGKQNGFKALIYMHRYNADTIGNLRIDYLHRLQKVYESEIARMQDLVDNSNNAKESTAAAKRRDKLVKQLQETKDYDQKIAHLALARTEIDLDDGVKVNYEKVQTGADGKKLQVLAKI